MNLVRLGHGTTIPQVLPERRDRRGVGVRRPVPDADATGRPAAVHDPREVFNAVRWMVRAGSPVALLADELPALGSGLPAIAAVDRGRLLRQHGPRPAGDAALARPPCRRPHGGDPRQPHRAEHAGERGAGWLGRPHEAPGQQGPPGRGHARPPARPARHRRRTPRIGTRSLPWPRRSRTPPGAWSRWPSSTRRTPADPGGRRRRVRDRAGGRAASRSQARSSSCPGVGS